MFVVGDAAEKTRLFTHDGQRGQHVRGRTASLHAKDRGIDQALVDARGNEEKIDGGESDAYHHARR